MKLRIFSLTFLILAGCSTVPSGFHRVNQFIADIESGLSIPPEDLQKICDRGSTAACALAGQKVDPSGPLAIAQGFATPTRTVLTVLAPKRATISYVLLVYGERGDSTPRILRRITPARKSERDFSNWRMDELQISNLSPTAYYILWVIGDDGDLKDVREFRTRDWRRPGRIVMASCMDDGFRVEQARVWSEIRQMDPNVMFFIGDNVYADKYIGLALNGADPKALWNRNVETRNALDVFRWPKLVPILATWDDHDFGINDGNETYAYKNESAEIHKIFFARFYEEPYFSEGPGVSFLFRAFKQKIFFLDDRSFRTPNRQDIPNQQHFGEQQEQWISTQASGRQPVWLISGDQIFGGYHHFESYEGAHPVQFERFKSRLRKLKAPVMFFSGDRHLIELAKIPKKVLGYTTYELTTSAIHARTFADAAKRNPNPNRLYALSGVYNFAELRLNEVKSGLSLRVIGRGLDKGVLFNRTLKIAR